MMIPLMWKQIQSQFQLVLVKQWSQSSGLTHELASSSPVLTSKAAVSRKGKRGLPASLLLSLSWLEGVQQPPAGRSGM